MIAVDTNLLVYAHREDSPFHDRAAACLSELAQGRSAWAIAWPCLHEFIAIVTHPKIYRPPSPLGVALDQVDAWLESPTLHLLGEMPGYWQRLRVLLVSGRITGPMVHDARIAALAIDHGVRELWSADRDLGRFAPLKVRNPLVES